jgi:hypothetical protein
MSLSAAEGYASLGLWREAWDALDGMSSGKRATSPVLRVKARCAIGLESWETAEVIALLLKGGDDEDRRHAASCFQSLAAHYLRAGKVRDSRIMIERAIAARPEQRMAILHDSRFPQDFI